MPITSSAKKALHRDRFLTDRNAYYKIAMKRAIKLCKKAIVDKKEKNEIEALYVLAQIAIDKASRRNIVHKANASRKKARLMALVHTA
jgi:small subunit ribosomal protein S20